jgi:hypothetical protein
VNYYRVALFETAFCILHLSRVSEYFFSECQPTLLRELPRRRPRQFPHTHLHPQPPMGMKVAVVGPLATLALLSRQVVVAAAAI